MKKKGFLLLFIFILLFIIFTKYNGKVKSFFLDFINPLKIAYLHFQNLGDSYFKQQESIIKLQKENKELRKKLLEQKFYIEQLSKIYKLVPSLAKKPYKSIYVVDTISYVKLNKFNEIMLTTPKNFKFQEKKLYGLIQKDVVAGVAEFKDNKLYGYLLSNPKATFSVVIGEDRVNGIAQGDNINGMVIKYIPRWSKVRIGDIVRTSGLDNIFFPNIPVGVITQVKTLDRYKMAKIKIYANIEKPSMFLLIADATPYLTTDYLPDTSFPNKFYPFITLDKDENITDETTQTQDETIEPKEPKEEEESIDILNQNLFFEKKFNLDFNQNLPLNSF
ncbi:MAG: rod shape-determining protein MreC [Epsilonproteobacteria bacterium]|nr:rod shape-determining protein MreC [Campylobacterota bacterium]